MWEHEVRKDAPELLNTKNCATQKRQQEEEEGKAAGSKRRKSHSKEKNQKIKYCGRTRVAGLLYNFESILRPNEKLT